MEFENMNQIKERMVNGRLPLYTSIGCYPLFYLTEYSEVLCAKCATAHVKQGHMLEAYDINYENDHMYCDECGVYIESAYGEDEE